MWLYQMFYEFMCNISFPVMSYYYVLLQTQGGYLMCYELIFTFTTILSMMDFSISNIAQLQGKCLMSNFLVFIPNSHGVDDLCLTS